MRIVPQRHSLVAETEKVLIEGIAAGRWQGALPGERRLCETLQVSRWTVREAIQALARRGVVRIEHGRSCRIVGSPQAKATGDGAWRVGCILPAPLWRLTSFTSFSFNELRVRIQGAGGQLEFFPSAKLYRPQCAGALAELVRQNPVDCWIVVLSTPWMQRWFQGAGVPVIVAGSLYEGVSLPFQDYHSRAVGRHAVGAFLARGHRRIALLMGRLSRSGVAPGILELERGGREACAASPGSELIPVVHEPGVPEICRTVDRLLRRSDPPTAILFAQSATLLTALTYLARLKVAVPEEISVAVIQDEAYYPSIVPALTHYQWDPELYAARLFRLLEQAREGRLSPGTASRLTPVFVAGATLTRRPDPAAGPGR